MTGNTSSKNVKLGTCNVIFNNEELGMTKGGVEVEVSTSTHEVTVDQFGDTPIGEIITGRMVSATVPLAETTLDNLVRIMPGATLETDGAFASGDITFASVPAASDKVTIAGTTFTFRTSQANVKSETDILVPATVNETAEILADTINGIILPVTASVSGAVVTITAENRGSDGNGTITTSGTGISSNDMSGGTDVTAAKVVVKTGVNTNLLSHAGKLVLRPNGTKGEDDFIIPNAATPGALNFTYNTDQERIYSAVFKGYAGNNGDLFMVGNEDV